MAYVESMKKEEVGIKMSTTPFFTIGIPTYRRRDLLRESLSSCLWQTFPDFEVIVANDCTEEGLSAEVLGIKDGRVKFINNTQNLGPPKNMNNLLEISRARYFIWLADDDMYAPDFLQSVYTALVKFTFPPCVFTSYMQGRTFPDYPKTLNVEGKLFTGREFLRHYLSRRLLVIPFYGVFDLEYLKRIGGIKRLCNGNFFPYSDNLLAIKASLLDRVVHIDVPLVFFRIHEQSISFVSPDVDIYYEAQMGLLSKSVNIFRSKGLNADFHSNLYLLLKWCLCDYCEVMRRSGRFQTRKMIDYISSLMKYIRTLGRHQYKMMFMILRCICKLLLQLIKKS